MSRWSTILGAVIGFLSVAVYLIDRNLESFYIFDKPYMHDLSKRAIYAHGNDTDAIVKYIVSELYEKYPSAVNPRHDDPSEWMFNNHGSAMGGMYIIHASLTEYLIIYGTPLGTEGHSGRHTADDYFHILTGEERAYVPGKYEPEIYPPGSVHHLKRGTVKQYKCPDHCFALELASGWIPPMLFFGFADTFTSTLDFPTLYRTVVLTAREMVGNLIRGKI
ncbi:unnamed protein product [Clonostachys rhizophaga]|uniref:C-8 sterol isomerase n=1 Tax=Clonostachys rhizophaga TaxID=160324 RepID=A0A9N9VQM4_9HYPO|nr:unnamed protein product [Clonostachys rhizophaga]